MVHHRKISVWLLSIQVILCKGTLTVNIIILDIVCIIVPELKVYPLSSGTIMSQKYMN